MFLQDQCIFYLPLGVPINLFSLDFTIYSCPLEYSYTWINSDWISLFDGHAVLKDKSNFTIIFVSVGYDKKALIEEQGQRSSNIIKYRNKMTTEWAMLNALMKLL